MTDSKEMDDEVKKLNELGFDGYLGVFFKGGEMASVVENIPLEAVMQANCAVSSLVKGAIENYLAAQKKVIEGKYNDSKA